MVLYQTRFKRRTECPASNPGVHVKTTIWNPGYNLVLSGTLLPRAAVIAYAHDKLVAVRGATLQEAAKRASVAALGLVLDRRWKFGEAGSPVQKAILCLNR